MIKEKRFARSWPAIAAAVLAATALAGCAGGNVAPSPTVAVEFDPDATLTVGVRLLGDTWDPSRQPGATTSPVDELYYDTLIGLDADLALVPELAENWSSDDDGQTWVLALREDVTFSDGTTFDAQDVKSTLEHYAAEGSTLRSQLAGLSSVEVVDDHHVRVVLSTPNVELPSLLAGQVGTMLSSDVITSGDFSELVGTGKFIMASYSPGVEKVMVANPDYWNPDAVKIAGVTVRAIDDPVAMANAVRSGEIDMAVIEPPQAASVESAGVSTYEITGAQLVTVFQNPDLAPELVDPRVRMALAMAIDRAGIIDGLYFGRGEEASQFIAPGRFGFNPDVEPIAYDIEGARALLAEAGYPDGFSLPYTMAVQANSKQLAETIQSSWAEIGVNIELTFPPGGAGAEATWVKPTIPMSLPNLVPGIDPASFLLKNLSPTAPRNPGNVEVPGTMQLIQQAQVTVDDNDREAIYQQIASLTRETVSAYTPIMWRNYTVAYSDKLVGMQEWQAGFPILDGVGVAK
ncbi:ABC transporter substrate-binding protein [Microbacterium sp. A93]|uniref:ABC transporter substrate-binding protein n=1 Tax=Microbacterium sp. A93 TaxID=3450716 RepID=UPI003F43E029